MEFQGVNWPYLSLSALQDKGGRGEQHAEAGDAPLPPPAK